MGESQRRLGHAPVLGYPLLAFLAYVRRLWCLSSILQSLGRLSSQSSGASGIYLRDPLLPLATVSGSWREPGVDCLCPHPVLLKTLSCLLSAKLILPRELPTLLSLSFPSSYAYPGDLSNRSVGKYKLIILVSHRGIKGPWLYPALSPQAQSVTEGEAKAEVETGTEAETKEQCGYCSGPKWTEGAERHHHWVRRTRHLNFQWLCRALCHHNPANTDTCSSPSGNHFKVHRSAYNHNVTLA